MHEFCVNRVVELHGLVRLQLSGDQLPDSCSLMRPCSSETHSQHSQVQTYKPTHRVPPSYLPLNLMYCRHSSARVCTVKIYTRAGILLNCRVCIEL